MAFCIPRLKSVERIDNTPSASEEPLTDEQVKIIAKELNQKY